MRRRSPRHLLLAIAVAVLVCGCNRNIEPFDPDEQPHEPDLSKIFPEGAERAEQMPPGLPPAPGQGRGAPSLAQESAAPSDAPPIEGRVELDSQLADGVPPGAVLFVIARRGQAGPPLAVKRVASPSFPEEFRIGPEDRMVQAMPFAGPIQLSALLDGDGNAMTHSAGDIQGTAPSPVEPGATGVVIRLDTAL